MNQGARYMRNSIRNHATIYGGLQTATAALRICASSVITAALLLMGSAAYGVSAGGRVRQAVSAPHPSAGASATTAASIPRPADVIGFAPGDDRKLASWAQITDYFRKLSMTSDRVKLEELGKTTLGRPFLLAIISSPENLSRLDRFKEIQSKLADPRTINSNDEEADKLIAEGRTIVLITCGIHSTEVGGNLVSMDIAYRLASDSSPETREILNNCVVLLVPSLNPDGVDIVKQWYDKTLGTPSEGTGPPELYHYYTGHDNNRDWYAFTQVETQMTIDKAHNLWHPQIVHDIHQQGESGSRFFLPPYLDPWEPNVPPRIQAGVNFMGSTMAWELTAQGKAGVVINGVYDAWTPARAYQHYHGGIRILSETASARLASPINIPFDNLTRQINVDPKTRTWNFPLVWSGGQWKLSNIIDYMQAGAFALLRNAARYRDRWVRDFYLVGKDAVRARTQGEPYAFLLVPPSHERAASRQDSAQPEPWLRYGMARLTGILVRGQTEVLRASAPFTAAGVQYPAGTEIVLMRQPYGAFAKALLERQHYPDIREYPGGPPRRPYDVTAQTLPLLMGVRTVRVDSEFNVPAADKVTLTDAARQVEAAALPVAGLGRVAIYKSHSPAIDEGWTRWIFDQIKVKYSSVVDSEIRSGGLKARYDCIIIPDQAPRQIAEGLSRDRYPAELAGGLGPSGIKSLKDFVEEGGTLITLNEASEFAIENLGVPVKNVLRGVPSKDFYCPGSILQIEFDQSDRLAQGVAGLEGAPPDGKAMAWFENGPALEITGPNARVVARFDIAQNVLLSGWLLGADKIGGQGAIVEATRGRGRVLMFAFAPQYRGQSWATLPFLINAMRAPKNDN